MGSNGYVGVSWGATDIYTRNGQLSGTGYDSRFVGWLRSHSGGTSQVGMVPSQSAQVGPLWVSHLPRQQAGANGGSS